MNIIFFTHPSFFKSVSIQKYTLMLSSGMKERGHNIEVWAPDAHVSRIKVLPILKKWLRYVDQFVLFPYKVRKRLKSCPPDTLFVFTDHALGPWVPMVKNRPHVIHCHDFLAQRSALDEIMEHKTSWTGRRYQSFIHKGYSKGKYFISVSQKTKEDLHRLLPSVPSISEVVYNGLNYNFTLHSPQKARSILSGKMGLDLSKGYLLHVGGNQWYKNRVGVIEIYEAFRKLMDVQIYLLLVGLHPDQSLVAKVEASKYKNDIHFLFDVDDDSLNFCYAGASVFLFPSIAEGFGWPIVEAMASGCPVITTGESPMTEVAGKAGFFIPRRPSDPIAVAQWAQEAAKVVNRIITCTPVERNKIVNAGISNAERFKAEKTIAKIESIYESLI